MVLRDWEGGEVERGVGNERREGGVAASLKAGS